MLAEVCSRISTISCPSTAPVYGMATNLPSGFVEPEESEHKTSATCETEFCNRDKSNTSGACGPFSRHLCDRLLQHATPNVYGHSGNDAKLTLFETEAGLASSGHKARLLKVPLLAGRDRKV